MSRVRVTVLCFAVAMTALLANSAAACALGLRPAIFTGMLFFVLASATLITWTLYAMAGRYDRAEQADEDQRVENFAMAVRYARASQRRAAYSSGSFPLPSQQDRSTNPPT